MQDFEMVQTHNESASHTDMVQKVLGKAIESPSPRRPDGENALDSLSLAEM
jgi:hypothetical protein